MGFLQEITQVGAGFLETLGVETETQLKPCRTGGYQNEFSYGAFLASLTAWRQMNPRKNQPYVLDLFSQSKEPVLEMVINPTSGELYLAIYNWNARKFDLYSGLIGKFAQTTHQLPREWQKSAYRRIAVTAEAQAGGITHSRFQIAEHAFRSCDLRYFSLARHPKLPSSDFILIDNSKKLY